MKTIRLFIFCCVVLASSVLCTSCNSLDLSPVDNYGGGDFWKTVPQIQAYMNGMHTDLRSTSITRNFVLGEARGGTSKSGTSSLNTSMNYDRIKENNLDASNTGTSSWAGLYGYIFDCNLMIQKVEGTALHLDISNKPAIDYALAQAYGIRAMYYFYLYRTYGGVPLNDRAKVMDGTISPEDLYTARSTPKQVMDFIKADLQKSLDYFGTNETINGVKSFWSKAATTMLAGEVYLWSAKVSLGDQTPATSDLTKAEGYLNTIKNDSRFELLSSFSPVFSAVSADKGNKEIIFTIRYAEGEATNSAGEFVYANPNGNFIGTVYGRDKKKITADTLLLKGNGWQRNEYVPTLWQAFDANDSRRDATFLEFYKADGSLMGTVLKKNLGYVNVSKNARIFCGDEPMYRYSDVLLLLAEVENMKGGDVASYINLVRARAYGTKWDPALYGYTNSDFKTNELAILHERDLEFVNEGTRWFDVCRMKDAKDGKPLVFDIAASYKGTPILNYATDKYKLLWPVDIATLNADPKLKQTPGYGSTLGQAEEVW